ncbi:DUF1636 family protein [Zavarzinia compransoris]|uniref:DUF1636 family protein n=1 Tax=Zavarzinia compransoris TaxID=1264899 RepID=UPI001414D16D|nr:DUF1636 domain-containing protein [Zavarzinia compransoris]
MSQDQPILHVCTSCRHGDDRGAGASLADRLETLAAGAEGGFRVNPIVCLAACERGCTAALSAAGKWSYVVGGLTPDLAGDMAAYARAYGASPNGVVLRAGRPVSLHQAIVSRLPPLPEPRS